MSEKIVSVGVQKMDRQLHPRAYIFFIGDSPAFPGRLRQEYTQEISKRKDLVVRAFKILESQERFDGSADDLKISYSRKAGCSCGCSPGFIIRNVNWNVDIFINVVDVDRPPRQTTIDRLPLK